MEGVVTPARVKLDRTAWQGRRVLLTGHSGFKGAWMSLLLRRLGAQVTGLSLLPPSEPNLFDVLAPWPGLLHRVCDIRDPGSLAGHVRSAQPEVVIHMAAQALVQPAYAEPVKTIDTNVMGTVNLLEQLRHVSPLAAVLVITSDKVYENREAGVDFPEDAALGGHDPYSASKAAAEILTAAYRRSYFEAVGVPLVTARAGNVIGGGDWARDRLIPDLWRAHIGGKPVHMRNPGAVRPWQHVLDPLYGYLLLLQQCMTAAGDLPHAVNFAPPRDPVRTVLEVAERFAGHLGATGLWHRDVAAATPRESGFLSIDSTLANFSLGWHTRLGVDEAIQWSADWHLAHRAGRDMREFSLRQVDAFAQRADEPALQAAGDA